MTAEPCDLSAGADDDDAGRATEPESARMTWPGDEAPLDVDAHLDENDLDDWRRGANAHEER